MRDYSKNPPEKEERFLLTEAVRKADMCLVKELLNQRYPVDPLSVDSAGENSALIFACDEVLPGLVDLLLKAGADPNYRTDLGDTALATAVFANSYECVKLLIEAGADAKNVDRFGVSVVDHLDVGTDPRVARLVLDAALGSKPPIY